MPCSVWWHWNIVNWPIYFWSGKVLLELYMHSFYDNFSIFERVEGIANFCRHLGYPCSRRCRIWLMIPFRTTYFLDKKSLSNGGLDKQNKGFLFYNIKLCLRLKKYLKSWSIALYYIKSLNTYLKKGRNLEGAQIEDKNVFL